MSFKYKGNLKRQKNSRNIVTMGRFKKKNKTKSILRGKVGKGGWWQRSTKEFVCIYA